MLRRKMLLILGSFVVLLVVLVVSSLWMLEGVLRQLNHLNTQATAAVEDLNDLSSQITRIEVQMYDLDLGRQRHLDDLIESVEALNRAATAVERHYVVHEPACEPIYRRLVSRIPEFQRSIGVVATAQDAAVARHYNILAISAASDLRSDILQINKWAHRHARQELLDLTRDFRNLVLGLALGALVVVNLSIVALLRVATTILRPVDKLVEASRQLAQERFDYRVQLDQKDEFDELGGAFNNLAEQLQANERRRLETLGQVALTLNHELNNAMGVIELQLRLLARQASGDPGQEKGLRQIHEALQRMARTVEQLKRIRRIVLTDYVSGVKMLDLERSVAADPPAEATAAPRPAEAKVAAGGAPGQSA